MPPDESAVSPVEPPFPSAHSGQGTTVVPEPIEPRVVRRLPVGAELQPEGGVHFRVWCPHRNQVQLVLHPAASPEAGSREIGKQQDGSVCVLLENEGNGYWSGLVTGAATGDQYGYQLDDGPVLPDPASRYQPEGPHGLSEIVDPQSFCWTDSSWAGPSVEGDVLYEMHIGTFTRKGDWQSAAERLTYLADLGVTILQVMPVADFPGRFGWGYDGVNLFAPTRLYGRPDEFRAFVDRAHSLGLAVILDVVYNHCGPDGNYLAEFSPYYFSTTRATDWGAAINFDGDQCQPVREFFLANVACWISEFHIDGLRIDATQDLYDSSERHILADIGDAVRQAAGGRRTYVVAENEPQDAKLVIPVEHGGYGLDSIFNEDFHHTAMVRLTGRAEAYYSDYRGAPQEFVSSARHGFLYQGQWYCWQQQRRGTPSLDLRPSAVVNFLQNHDQIANSGRGLRCHALSSAGTYRAMTAVLLLSPATPMLFQGQDFASSSPFFYFADHNEELAQLVQEGRRDFMKQFRSLSLPLVQEKLPDPGNPDSFERSRLNWKEVERHAEVVALHRDLLKLRRTDPVLSLRPCQLDGAVLSDDALLLRYFAPDGLDRLLVVNFGPDLHFSPAPEPLLAPPAGWVWDTLWSSEDFEYGGSGTPPLGLENKWDIQGQTAVVLHPVPIDRIS